jgi:hypothetical protein
MMGCSYLISMGYAGSGQFNKYSKRQLVRILYFGFAKIMQNFLKILMR